MINPNHPELTVSKQCELLNLTHINLLLPKENHE